MMNKMTARPSVNHVRSVKKYSQTNQQGTGSPRMYARHLFLIAIGILCIHDPACAQDVNSKMLHDFDGVGDISSLRTDNANFELVDGGRSDRGRAMRVSFDAVGESPDAYPSLMFEKSSLPNKDFNQYGLLSFWVKNEGNKAMYIKISVQDLDGRRSPMSPDRVYVSAGAWRQILYRLDLQGLDRKRIGSLQLFRHSKGPALPLLVDDIKLLTQLAAQLGLLESQIRGNIERAQDSAKRIGLETFIESDAERLTQQLREATSLPTSERLPVLSQLARESANLAGTIGLIGSGRPGPPTGLRLRGPQVTDAWLAACAPKIAEFETVDLDGTSISDAGLAHLRSHRGLKRLLLRSPGITGSGLKGFASTKLSELNLARSGVNDAGLESIKAFQIDSIYLGDTGVTDAGLRHLSGMKSLRVLGLRDTPITDVGLSHLRDLTALESLYLQRTDVTSLAKLGALKNLKRLDLTEARVDDAGLAGLGACSELDALLLAKTNVLGPGLANFKDAKSCRISLSTARASTMRVLLRWESLLSSRDSRCRVRASRTPLSTASPEPRASPIWISTARMSPATAFGV